MGLFQVVGRALISIVERSSTPLLLHGLACGSHARGLGEVIDAPPGKTSYGHNAPCLCVSVCDGNSEIVTKFCRVVCTKLFSLKLCMATGRRRTTVAVAGIGHALFIDGREVARALLAS